MIRKGLHTFLLIAMMAGTASLYAPNTGRGEINADGTIFDEYDHAVGWISKQGVVQTAEDDRVAVIDKDGNAFDGKGQRIGRMEKRMGLLSMPTAR